MPNCCGSQAGCSCVITATSGATVTGAGTVNSPYVIGGLNLNKASIAAQSAGGFATDTYVTGSDITIPQSNMQPGVVYNTTIQVSKTAAGTAAPVVNLRYGTAGSTADTSRGTYTSPSVGTAVADEGQIDVYATFYAAGTSAVIQSWMKFTHGLSATGFLVVPIVIVKATSASFDSTVAGSKIGVSVNGGSSAAWTVNAVQTRLWNIA